MLQIKMAVVALSKALDDMTMERDAAVVAKVLPSLVPVVVHLRKDAMICPSFYFNALEFLRLTVRSGDSDRRIWRHNCA